jgi:hypothetical protein
MLAYPEAPAPRCRGFFNAATRGNLSPLQQPLTIPTITDLVTSPTYATYSDIVRARSASMSRSEEAVAVRDLAPHRGHFGPNALSRG